MINVLFPCMGKSIFFQNSFFPKILYEINGETMLERIIDNYSSVPDKRFLFVFGSEECKTFHVDESAKIKAGPNSRIIVLNKETSGALCTSLMAIDYINDDQPLIISNSDQIIDLDFSQAIRFFDAKKADAGIIVFNSIHPRWSFARVEKESDVVEVMEKRPISNHAIAGFYYFKRGSDFVKAAENAILKDSSTNGIFYLSAALNEIILMNKRVVAFPIEKRQYHSFYSPDKIQDFIEDTSNENKPHRQND